MGDGPLSAALRLLGGPSDGPVAAAEAPGRVNLIGEHTDYNGGLVLPAALDRRTAVAVRLRERPGVKGVSREEGESEALLGDPPRGLWLDYVRGVALELSRSRGIALRGLEVGVASDVPCGAGLSSSAALEVATALALARAGERPWGPEESIELARLCQRAEAGFVGVPCGLLDPFAAMVARDGHSVLLDCASMVWEAVPVPREAELLIVDTGVRRSLRDGGYAERRRECEQALGASARLLGRPLATLSEIGPEELGALEAGLPDLLLRRARHVVTENARVLAFASALRAADLDAAGSALYASHASLRRDYEVTCPESDSLVELSASIPGVRGARMTGAGWGGCTVHLIEAGKAESSRERLEDGFSRRYGRRPRAWRMRPGPGARVCA